ncbi:uncharacterized protein At4g15545-like [Asparagus officinalis]|uniref:uncharacterized protein At4g15545-like n=1 Tax=Asparagus officinalis TaxID=4686 RepID=UPI00098DEBA4|nr:uncharacterized protein At4g15545-like [Asparagus officinalis]
MAQNGSNFHLPDEILSVIPTDPYDQLDLARRITSMAIASRVSKLESEAGRLRQKNSEKDRTIADLREQIAELDRMFRDSEARLRIALEDNAKLMKERDTLALTSKKLGKDLSKLETFKRQLMQSLNDDNSSQPAESVDMETSDQSTSRISSWQDEASISRRGLGLVSVCTETGDPIQGPGSSANKLSVSPYITPRLTPAATPIASTSVSPRGFSTAGSSPKFWSGSASPTKSCFEAHSFVSSLNTSTSSQQSSTSSSPPTGLSLSGRAPRIDGKEFFRQVRTRLSYEQFGAFLANIKELNAHRQSREETLEKAEKILGADNNDLYISFQRLLNRNLT